MRARIFDYSLDGIVRKGTSFFDFRRILPDSPDEREFFANVDVQQDAIAYHLAHALLARRSDTPGEAHLPRHITAPEGGSKDGHLYTLTNDCSSLEPEETIQCSGSGDLPIILTGRNVFVRTIVSFFIVCTSFLLNQFYGKLCIALQDDASGRICPWSAQ